MHNPNDGLKHLLLDLNSYFASCEQELNPSLREKPIAVVPMLNVETTCCLAASYEAKAFGIKTGTLVKDAKQMCPGIIFIQARHEHYVYFHHQIINAVESCIPIAQVLSIDEMLCELTGSQKKIEIAVELSKKIKNTIRSKVGQCLRCSIGLSTNPFLAKVASDMKKPDGLTLILKKDLPELLYTLKLRDFPGIGPQMEKRINQFGIVSVKQLCQLTQAEMKKLWGGINGDRFYLWLQGEDISLPHSKSQSLGHQHVLEPKLRDRKSAYQVTQKLLIRAARRLRREGFYTKKISLHVRFADSYDSFDSYENLEETQDTLTLLHAITRLWEKLPQHKPFKVGVTLSNLIEEKYHQFSLFKTESRENLMQTIDKINDKFKDKVYFGALCDHNKTATTKIAFRRIPKMSEF
ncbi:MAG: DNA polymerase [Deltaproteobacteria bacterium]|nr:DNA polymerase [Deltaproteobacteria bacterium]